MKLLKLKVPSFHSRRGERTVGNKNKKESSSRNDRSIPPSDLEKKPSDDSSVFSGLADNANALNKIESAKLPIPPPPPPPPPNPPPPKETRQPKGILRAPTRAIQPTQLPPSTPSQESGDPFLNTESDLSESQLSNMRGMRPMADVESTLGNSTISTVSSFRMRTNSNSVLSTDSMESELMKTIRNVASSFPDGETQMTWASANQLARPKGVVKLLSSVTYLKDEAAAGEQKKIDGQVITECESNGSDSGIEAILDNFEKQMDSTIRTDSQVEDETDVLADFNKDLMPQSLKVQSKESESEYFLTPHKARKLQAILHRARIEVQVLKDNNNQCKSSIEQMQEDQKLKLKLVEDRAKHELKEIQNLYQDEINSIMQEKEAAEQKHAEIMINEFEKLKEAAALEIGEKIEQERQAAAIDKEEEIAALKESYEYEFEKLRREFDERLDIEIEEATSSEANRIASEQDGLINILTAQIESLQNERYSSIELAKSVKKQLEESHPEEMIQFMDISMGCSEGLQTSLDENSLELIKEAFHMFTFVLQNTEKRAQLSAEKFNAESQKCQIRQRAEIEQLKQEREEKNQQFWDLEEEFKALSRKTILLEERYRTESESHELKLKRLDDEKKTFVNIERTRKDLEHAMAVGQRELANQKVIMERRQFSTRAKRDDVETTLDFDSRFAQSIPSARFSRNSSGFSKTGKKQDSEGQTSKLTPEKTDKCEERRDNHSMSSHQSIESPSVRKLRSFHMNRSKYASRHSVSNHPSNSNPSIKSPEKACQVESDKKLCVVTKIKDSSEFGNELEEAEDILTSPIHAMNPENQGETASDIHVKLEEQKKIEDLASNEERKQVEEKKQDDSTNLSLEQKIKMSREKPKRSASIPKRKKPGTPRSVQSNKEFNRTFLTYSKKSEEKEEIEEKSESVDVLRRARMFRTYREDSIRRSRRSIDDEISCSKYNDDNGSDELTEDLRNHSNGKPNDEDNGPSNASTQIKKHVSPVQPDADTKCSKVITNHEPFAQEKVENVVERNPELDIFDRDISSIESKDDLEIPPPPTCHSITDDGRDKVQGFQEEEAKQPFKECSSHLNSKRSPPVVDCSMKSTSPRVSTGKSNSNSGSKNRFSALKSRARVKAKISMFEKKVENKGSF